MVRGTRRGVLLPALAAALAAGCLPVGRAARRSGPPVERTLRAPGSTGRHGVPGRVPLRGEPTRFPGDVSGRPVVSTGVELLAVSRMGHAALGVEGGLYSFREDDFRTWFEDGAYFGMRCSKDLGLNLAWSLSAGYFKAETKVTAGEDLETFPLRVGLEIGSHLGLTLSRWYLGGGGGYNISDEYPSDEEASLWPAELPHLESEWTAHVVAGLEIRNETILITRIEFGHSWLLSSSADVWTAVGTLSWQF